jgi:hypothetical protein
MPSIQAFSETGKLLAYSCFIKIDHFGEDAKEYESHVRAISEID